MSCPQSSSFLNWCYGDESRSNAPAYKDGTFWTMLAAMAISLILASVVAVPSRLTRFESRAGALIDKELFFIPVPEWIIPVFFLAMHVTLFLGVYLTYRNINANTNISAERRNKSKSYMWLLYLVTLVSNFLWVWAYLGAGEPAIGFVFLGAMTAAVVCILVLAGSENWGGNMNGSWWLLWPTAAYLILVAMPLNFMTAFMSNGKNKTKNKSMRDKPGSSSKSSFLGSTLSSLAP